MRLTKSRRRVEQLEFHVGIPGDDRAAEILRTDSVNVAGHQAVVVDARERAHAGRLTEGRRLGDAFSIRWRGGRYRGTPAPARFTLTR